MWSVFRWKNPNKAENHFAEVNFGETRWLMYASYNCHKNSLFNHSTLGLLKIKVFRNKGYEVIISIHDVTNKFFFEGWSWFKFNNLGLALGMTLKFYTSVAKGLKLKVRKLWGLIPTFVEFTGEKLVGGVFLPHPE